MANPKPRPAWLDDETILPPYPIMRCPRCKGLFSDHGIHICADLNKNEDCRTDKAGVVAPAENTR